MLPRATAGLVRFASHRAGWVAVAALLLTLGAGLLVVQRFELNSDVTQLFPQDLPWREAELAMFGAFPEREELIAVVVDGTTADIAERAAAALAANLATQPARFEHIARPDGLPFFRRNGLLFLPAAEVQATTERIIAAQPLLGTLAADPSLRGLATAFGLVLEGVARGQARLDSVAAPLRALADSAEAANLGRVRPLDWGALFTGRAPGPLELRRFVVVKPRLEFSELSSGSAATAAIRAAATRLGLNAEAGVRVRLTGQVPMADEDFASVSDGALRNTSLSLLLVSLWLWLALRSWRLILPVLATLLVGLAVTAAFGAVAIGPFNPLSIAFAVLFIGLGVDFGIQFAMRAREQRRIAPDLTGALVAAGRLAGPAIALAAAAIALGFLAFLPTDYRGVSELGAIAGFGMLAAGLLSLSLLPALLRLLAPAGERAEVGWSALAPLDRWLGRHARAACAAVAVLVLAALAVLPALRFDFDPLHLRDPHSEAVATFYELMRSPETTPNTLSVLVPDLAAAPAVAARLAALPEIAQVLSLHSFVPGDQPPKLALIADAAELLGPTLAPPEVRPAPTPAESLVALHGLAAALRGAAPAGSDGQRLAAALDDLEQAPDAGLPLLDRALIPGLRGVLDQLAEALQAAPVTLDSLPAELRRDWVAADGRARIEVYPHDLSDSNDSLRRFAAAVRAVAPGASGTAISILGSSGTIRTAFIRAGGIAGVLTFGLLLLALRSLRLALLALAPLLLAGLLTLACCALLGPDLNLANIIALPLLFGIGVAFDIYFVAAWRDGERALLSSAIARAVVFSALTTASAFGTLALSVHPGTASMGVLLAMALGFLLFAVLFVLPALLRVFAGNLSLPLR